MFCISWRFFLSGDCVKLYIPWVVSCNLSRLSLSLCSCFFPSIFSWHQCELLIFNLLYIRNICPLNSNHKFLTSPTWISCLILLDSRNSCNLPLIWTQEYKMSFMSLSIFLITLGYTQPIWVESNPCSIWLPWLVMYGISFSPNPL